MTLLPASLAFEMKVKFIKVISDSVGALRTVAHGWQTWEDGLYGAGRSSLCSPKSQR